MLCNKSQRCSYEKKRRLLASTLLQILKVDFLVFILLLLLLLVSI